MSRIFGKIAQIVYVVRDIDASIDQGCAAASGPGSMSIACRPISSCTEEWSLSWK